MKEITITETIILPTEEEIIKAAKNRSPIAPKQATVINCFVENWDKCGKEVFQCMKDNDKLRRDQIAIDVAFAYCYKHNIPCGSIRILWIGEFDNHFVIEALAEAPTEQA